LRLLDINALKLSLGLKVLLFNFVVMTRKLVKVTRSKGERLGWTPLDQVKYITLKSVNVHGRKVSVCQRQELHHNEAAGAKFIIP
jgi:hypothetical protein